jgi:hypothetical protein
MLSYTVATMNKQIQQVVCYDTLAQLTDEALMSDFMECDSVTRALHTLGMVLSTHVDEDTSEKIKKDYVRHIIPPGTKGVIRGNKFNRIVKQRICDMGLNPQRYDVKFETRCPSVTTSEKPDWYILDKITSRSIIGMNQMDLWNGGQQLNRGSKYIMETINTENNKLLCVVCYEKQFITSKTKAFRLFVRGFSDETMCYLTNLPSIILRYFNLPTESR